MRAETLDATVVDYINEIKAGYEQQITTLENNNQKLKNNVVEYHNKYLEIKERYDLLIYKQYMRSAEQIPSDDNQQLLFSPETEPIETSEQYVEEEKTEVRTYSRKKPGRKPIDSRIPREIVIVDIPENEKTCTCGCKLTKIGEEISEKLEFVPQSISVKQFHRLKYACRSCEGTANEPEDGPAEPTVRIAPVQPSMIPRSISSPSLLSAIFTHKFEDHLPYYRQEKQFERIGVEISRQDMSNWQQQVFNRLAPLFDLLKETVKSGPVIQMDETTVQVIGEEDRRNTQNSYMWLARGGPSDKKVVWYEYHKTRAGKNAKEFLKGYSGYLQTDGYEGYDYAVKDMPGIVHVGCFAHARRYFFEALKGADKAASVEEGIKHIRKLYYLENKLRSQNMDDKEFILERKKEAELILGKFKLWLLKRADEVPPSRLLGKAIHYSLNQWDKMTAYLESPNLTPDNNACENAIRPFVLGRKNWLFCQSPEGAKSSCGIYTLIGTAKQNDFVPAHYLTALFEKAPLASSPDDWEKLLPWNIFTT
jgi:transposase